MQKQGPCAGGMRVIRMSHLAICPSMSTVAARQPMRRGAAAPIVVVAVGTDTVDAAIAARDRFAFLTKPALQTFPVDRALALAALILQLAAAVVQLLTAAAPIVVVVLVRAAGHLVAPAVL